MNRISSARLIGFLVIAFGMLGLANRASAEVRPYSSRGTAQFVSPTDFIGSGFAKHLGAYKEVGCASFSPTADAAVRRIDARAIYTAANDMSF